MEFVYGYSVAAELQPEAGLRRGYKGVLGGYGELVRAPGQMRGAFERALASGKPSLRDQCPHRSTRWRPPRRSNLTSRSGPADAVPPDMLMLSQPNWLR